MRSVARMWRRDRAHPEETCAGPGRPLCRGVLPRSAALARGALARRQTDRGGDFTRRHRGADRAADLGGRDQDRREARRAGHGAAHGGLGGRRRDPGRHRHAVQGRGGRARAAEPPSLGAAGRAQPALPRRGLALSAVLAVPGSDHPLGLRRRQARAHQLLASRQAGGERCARERRDRRDARGRELEAVGAQLVCGSRGPCARGRGGAAQRDDLDRVRPREYRRSLRGARRLRAIRGRRVHVCGVRLRSEQALRVRADREQSDRAVHLRPGAPRARPAAPLGSGVRRRTARALAAHGQAARRGSRRRPAQRPFLRRRRPTGADVDRPRVSGRDDPHREPRPLRAHRDRRGERRHEAARVLRVRSRRRSGWTSCSRRFRRSTQRRSRQ